MEYFFKDHSLRNYTWTNSIGGTTIKIRDIQCQVVRIPLRQPTAFSTKVITAREYTIVRVITDEGITGIGYSFGGRLVKEGVLSILKDLVIGEDPFDVERIWHKMFYNTLLPGRRGAIIRGISCIDIALWDIMGKAVQKPIYKLLGGYRDKVPAYASGGYYREGKTPLDLADEIAGYVEKGFKAVKIKVGRLSLKEEVERVRRVREAIGEDISLMLDANNAYPDAKTAIKAGRLFEAYNIQWIEEPVMPDNIQASAEIKAALETPIATGEIEGTRWGFRDLIERKAADILQPDVTVVGGITEWMKVAHMAGGWDIPVAPHYFWDIHVHLVAATSNSLTVEYFLRESDIVNFDDLLIEPLQPVQGFLEVPQKPGLGIDLNEEAVQRFEIK